MSGTSLGGSAAAHSTSPSPTFPLFTSIKPPAGADELAYLRDCLDSWRRAGFDAIAVNGPSEIAMLRKLDMPVQFSALPTDGRPRIGAILGTIRESGARFAGIINSDCRIICYPNLASHLAKGLDETVLVGWRMDVGDSKPVASFGFDAYFLDTAFLPEDDAGFRIGDPWWDYWFPLACEVAGAKIETFPAPLLTHKVHPLNYTQRNEIGGCMRFWAALKKWYADDRSLPSWPFNAFYRRHRVTKTFAPEQVGELSGLVRPWICQNAARVAVMPGMDEIETMLRLGGEALLADIETRHLRSEIAVLRNSISWRMTAPLRRAMLAARSVKAVVGL